MDGIGQRLESWFMRTQMAEWSKPGTQLRGNFKWTLDERLRDTDGWVWGTYSRH